MPESVSTGKEIRKHHNISELLASFPKHSITNNENVLQQCTCKLFQRLAGSSILVLHEPV